MIVWCGSLRLAGKELCPPRGSVWNLVNGGDGDSTRGDPNIDDLSCGALCVFRRRDTNTLAYIV